MHVGRLVPPRPDAAGGVRAHRPSDPAPERRLVDDETGDDAHVASARVIVRVRDTHTHVSPVDVVRHDDIAHGVLGTRSVVLDDVVGAQLPGSIAPYL